MQHYRCYFITKDGTGRSLASIEANDPVSAVRIATTRYPLLKYREVEVWENSDRVLSADGFAMTQLARH